MNAGVQVEATYRGQAPFMVSEVSKEGADQLMFVKVDRETGTEETMSVAHYFQVIKKQPLRFPKLQCVVVRFCVCKLMSRLSLMTPRVRVVLLQQNDALKRACVDTA
jgi:hypothetical protein